MSEVVGYVPGLFDLFHVGHLDLLRRARAQCDRLIAGVFTDELSRLVWGRDPYVSLPERMEIVANVRYVDWAVPLARLDVREICRELGFHKLFVGRTRIGLPAPEELQKLLEGTGVRVVAFPDERLSDSDVLRAALGGDPAQPSVA